MTKRDLRLIRVGDLLRIKAGYTNAGFYAIFDSVVTGDGPPRLMVRMPGRTTSESRPQAMFIYDKAKVSPKDGLTL